MDILLRCPGLYCGRILQADGNWSDCGACPRGFRSNSSSACVPCEDVPMFYDWLYLGFMALIALVLHWSCIDSIALHFSIVKKVIVLHILAFLEMVTAALATLKIINPDGLFDIKSCRVNRLSDWYTLMHNPTPNYDTNLHCTQEAVYPLYTIVFVFYAMCVVNMLLIRTIIVNRFFPKKGKYTIYAALYFFPLLALLHAIAGGLIYYSFPYITIVLSVISNATHFAFKLKQTMKSLLLSSISDIRSIVVILGHWLLHGYGIMAIATLQGITIHPAMLALVPLPAVFYILTVKFTDPHKVHNE